MALYTTVKNYFGEIVKFWTGTYNRSPGMMYVTYTTRDCRSCRHLKTACTTMSRGRRIYRWEHQELVDDMKKRLRDNPSMMSLRKGMCEHPFGTIKRAFNQSYLLLKGFRKVRGEIGLTMLSYNLFSAVC